MKSKDSNWKWGIFYYNPADKRLFPPKRLPWMGWTVNFANWKSVFVFLLILIVISAIVAVLGINQKTM